ncbi:TPA: hypothetical protein ACVU5M_004522 [Vibrio parahaemolyticus]
MTFDIYKLTAAALCTLVLSGCTTFQKPNIEARVPSTLSSYEFNDLSSSYAQRPTFVTVESKNDKQFLHVTTNEYGKIGYDPEKVKHVFFAKEKVSEYVSLIDKYLDWEALASSREDLLEKEIGQVDNLIFDFYSGNPSKHYLVISTSVSLDMRLWPMYFPKKEAQTLKELLVKFERAEFKGVNEDLYN